MSYAVAPFVFDFVGSRLHVDAGTVDVSVIDIYGAAKIARASEEGILYDAIAAGSGLVDLGGGTAVGLTVALLASWQLKFPEGNYIARVSRGNLVGGPGGDPIAYSAGVQTLLIQSAASTVVMAGGGSSAPTAQQNAAAVWAASQRSLTGTVPADVRAVNGVNVSGTGAVSDPWGPAP